MRAKVYRKVIEEDPSVMVIKDGQPTLGLRVSMQDEEVEQIRQGAECINCWEVFDTTFPESCPVCAFPVRDQQLEQFAKTFAGHKPGLRTGTDWEAAADRLEERAEQRAFRRKMERQGVSAPSIVVPRGFDV